MSKTPTYLSPEDALSPEEAIAEANRRGLPVFEMPVIVGKPIGKCTKKDLQQAKTLHLEASKAFERMEQGNALSESELAIIRRADDYQRELRGWMSPTN